MEKIHLLAEKLQHCGIHFSLSEPMCRHTTLRIGGAADCFVVPESETEVCLAASLCREIGVPFSVIGNGSDLLVADAGVRGAVLCLGPAYAEIRRKGDCLLVTSGTSLPALCEAAAKESLAGLAFAAGIPGSVGGAVFMNAGAYGGEVCNVLESVRVLLPDGEIHEYTAEECRFSYRRSRFQEETESIILSVAFSLIKGNEEKIREEMALHRTARQKSQPLDLPNAGSAFRRPGEGLSAASMIDACGLKGTTVGGAAVSEKHAGFLVNRGGATCCEVEELLSLVQSRVAERYGILLETEYCKLGGNDAKE